MTRPKTGLLAIDTLAFAQELMAAGMPEDDAKALVRAYRDISCDDPLAHDPVWIMDRLSAAGVTPEVARVMTRQFQETGALLEKRRDSATCASSSSEWRACPGPEPCMSWRGARQPCYIALSPLQPSLTHR